MVISLNKKVLSVSIGIMMALSVLMPAFLIGSTAHAQQLTSDELFGENIDPSLGGAGVADSFGLGQASLTDSIAAIIRIALGFLGIIAVIIILFGGFKWMTAGGNDDKVGEAKKLMISGLIGLVIILAAYAVASFVITNLVNVTT